MDNTNEMTIEDMDIDTFETQIVVGIAYLNHEVKIADYEHIEDYIIPEYIYSMELYVEARFVTETKNLMKEIARKYKHNLDYEDWKQGRTENVKFNDDMSFLNQNVFRFGVYFYDSDTNQKHFIKTGDSSSSRNYDFQGMVDARRILADMIHQIVMKKKYASSIAKIYMHTPEETCSYSDIVECSIIKNHKTLKLAASEFTWTSNQVDEVQEYGRSEFMFPFAVDTPKSEVRLSGRGTKSLYVLKLNSYELDARNMVGDEDNETLTDNIVDAFYYNKEEIEVEEAGVARKISVDIFAATIVRQPENEKQYGLFYYRNDGVPTSSPISLIPRYVLTTGPRSQRSDCLDFSAIIIRDIKKEYCGCDDAEVTTTRIPFENGRVKILPGTSFVEGLVYGEAEEFEQVFSDSSLAVAFEYPSAPNHIERVLKKRFFKKEILLPSVSDIWISDNNYRMYLENEQYKIKINSKLEICFDTHLINQEKKSELKRLTVTGSRANMELKRKAGTFVVTFNNDINGMIVSTVTKEKSRFFCKMEDLIVKELIPEALTQKIKGFYSCLEPEEIALTPENVLHAIVETMTMKDWEQTLSAVADIIDEYSKTYIGNKSNVLSKVTAESKWIADILFPIPYEVNQDVVNTVYYEWKKYKKTGTIPDFAFLGTPGIGKTTLAKGLARVFLGGNSSEEAPINMISISDLKGRYLGHTKDQLMELIADASKNHKILFIDEAYELTSDRYGSEALANMLPIMSGDRTSIKWKTTNSHNADIENSHTFTEKSPRPSIWMAGYEREMRVMISSNPGLYRRLVPLKLEVPTVDKLYGNLYHMARTDENRNTEMLCKYLDNSAKEIKAFLAWASRKEYVPYFANYAGVRQFYENADIRLMFADSEDEAYEILNLLIAEQKQEYKSQYKNILASKREDNGLVSEFEVVTDITDTFNDVRGSSHAKTSLMEIADILLDIDEYKKRGVSVPKGALMIGPPGTGKTMLARALAGTLQNEMKLNPNRESSIGFIPVGATELRTPRQIEDLFDQASEYDISIIFIDEIDAIGRMRNSSGATPELLIQLMKEMDGFDGHKGIFVIAATNAPEVLDPALKRPGRFDRIIPVEYPNKNERADILELYISKLHITEYDREQVIKLAKEVANTALGYTPSELKNLVNEAALLYLKCMRFFEMFDMRVTAGEDTYAIENLLQTQCIHRKKQGASEEFSIDNYNRATGYEGLRMDLLEVIEREQIGMLAPTKKEEFSLEVNDGMAATAVHEVGHAFAHILQGSKPFERITVIARGNALGYVMPARDDVRGTKQVFMKNIAAALGGRAAEELFYGKENVSAGAVSDLKKATSIAKSMVCQWGMSESIGTIALEASSDNYLERSTHQTLYGELMRDAEKEIQSIVKSQYQIIYELLKLHKDELEHMARFVYDEETVTGKEFIDELEHFRAESK